MKKTMPSEVQAYFIEQYSKSHIRVVPGHHPTFQTKLEVDEWISGIEQMSNYIDWILKKQEDTP